MMFRLMSGYMWVDYRSSRPDVFCKKGVLRNFSKSTENDLCQSLYLNKVAETLAQLFS